MLTLLSSFFNLTPGSSYAILVVKDAGRTVFCLRYHCKMFGGACLKIQESAENYLETILVLSLDKPYVRSIDIANELGFSKPSVSVAMKNLRNSGHIRVDENGQITLAPPGKKIAEMIYERHRILSQWLESLGVSRETASEDACRIEHVISEESFAAIKDHLKQTSV